MKRKDLCAKCYAKKYRKEHPGVAKAYYKRTKEKQNAYSKKYHKENREHTLKLGEEYRKNNRQELRDWQKKYRGKEYGKVISGERKRHDKKYFDGLREEILERDGYKCIKCGISQKEQLLKNGRYLSIHHIDGKGSNVKKPNNEKENLKTLCGSCHTKEHNKRRGFKVKDS